ncbi:MAG: hypothetical protein ACE5EX_05095 [Phycisphaerae bacterium]
MDDAVHTTMNDSHWRRILVTAALVVQGASATAWAQTAARLPDEEGGWLKWIIAAGLGVVCCLAGFLNAKRSHLT